MVREPTVPRTPPFMEVIDWGISLLEGKGSGNRRFLEREGLGEP
jgi:hypothetical protein